MSVTSRRHFTSIDALRGFAALSVVLFHLGGAGLPKLSTPLTTSLTAWGWTGVEVFFVISGFVIPFVMLNGKYHWRDGGNFLARRFIRIWPPSAILIALTVLQYAVVNRLGQGDPGGWTNLSAERVVANLSYAVPFTNQSWLNGILWTLAVEFQFYLALALIFPLLMRHWAWIAATGAASLVTALLPGAEQALFLKNAIYFAMGGVALLYREERIGRPAMLALVALMGIVATAQIGLLPTGFAASTALIIALLPLRNRLFIFLGTISYSLYLTHILIASTAEFLLLRMFNPVTEPARLAAQFACLGAAIAGAWLFYWLVERHFVTWSQRFARQTAPKPHAQDEATPPSQTT